jgi:RNA polymerase sigma factor (sigma-70 family)
MSKSVPSKTSPDLETPDARRAQVERAFRSTHGRLTAALVRRFGMDNLARIENALQEAGLRALERWEGSSSSTELEGWLLRVAHNALIDSLRHDRRSTALSEEEVGAAAPPTPEVDDELRLVFLSCHPSLPRAAQIALTLRIAFGFTTAQIARAFLSDERTIAQRIVRAKQRLRDEGTKFELPEPDEVPSRLVPILDVIYQLFSEGYSTTQGEAGIDEALCADSLRLARLLTDDARWTSPSAEALRALFCFHVARAPGRVADDGSLLLLHEQDRSRWDRALLDEAFVFLARSARGEELSRFHLEAGIAACHARAPSYAETDWTAILSLYDVLREASPSPVVDVNRALAFAMCHGAVAGIDELDAIPERELVARYPYALAAYAELHASLGHIDEARAYLDAALEQQASPAERALLERKRAALASSAARGILA